MGETTAKPKRQCRLIPGEISAECGAIGARAGVEAQHGHNDTYEGDPYPNCGRTRINDGK